MNHCTFRVPWVNLGQLGELVFLAIFYNRSKKMFQGRSNPQILKDMPLIPILLVSVSVSVATVKC